MGQERDAFLKVRTELEAHTSFASTDIFWGWNQKPEQTRTKAVLLDDGGRVINDTIPKIGSNAKTFTTSCKIILLVRVLPDATAAATSESMGITDSATGILDLWADVESAIGSGTSWSGTTGVPSSYRKHVITEVSAVAVDEYPGWRGRQAEIHIDLAE